MIYFYYSGVECDFSPQELVIARANRDSLIFSKPMLINELGEKLGNGNVDWLWLPSKR